MSSAVAHPFDLCRLPLGKLPDGARVALVTVGGSRAYGTDHAESDSDLRGVYLTPVKDLLWVTPPAATVERAEPDDVVLHELGKFVQLAAVKANPSALEWLWAPVLFASSEGEMLRAHRQAFLSRKVFKTYGGFARSSLEQAKRGSGGTRGRSHLKRSKHLLHLLRVMEQGVGLVATGDLTLRVEDPQALRRLAERGLEAVERRFEELEQELHAALAQTPLPEEPDYETLRSLMTELRNLS